MIGSLFKRVFRTVHEAVSKQKEMPQSLGCVSRSSWAKSAKVVSEYFNLVAEEANGTGSTWQKSVDRRWRMM
jgi:hypothetical protein